MIHYTVMFVPIFASKRTRETLIMERKKDIKGGVEEEPKKGESEQKKMWEKYKGLPSTLEENYWGQKENHSRWFP